MGWFPVATDYDAPRKTEEDIREESLEELKARRADKQATMIDEEETEIVDLRVRTCLISRSRLASCRNRPTSSPVRNASWCTTAASW